MVVVRGVVVVQCSGMVGELGPFGFEIKEMGSNSHKDIVNLQKS